MLHLSILFEISQYDFVLKWVPNILNIFSKKQTNLLFMVFESRQHLSDESPMVTLFSKPAVLHHHRSCLPETLSLHIVSAPCSDLPLLRVLSIPHAQHRSHIFMLSCVLSFLVLGSSCQPLQAISFS